MLHPVSIILIGAGNRGRGIFGQYALDMPHRAKFVGVVEPDDAKRAEFSAAHGISKEMQFRHYNELFAKERLADAVVIATLENERVAPILGAIKLGYNLLVEKPLGTSIDDIVRITDAARAFDGVFMVCHQMRYVPLYNTIKGLLESGKYGEVVCIQHSENLSFSHMAHSFVRGLFNNSEMSPMILAKCCHDMDILRWWIGKRPQKVASFGSLKHFKPENAPTGAPDFCLDGCPAEAGCPFSVLKLYFNDDTDQAYIRQMGVVSSKKQLMELLKTNQFGRCVYHAGNNVVDNQIVQMLFDDDVTVTHTMCGHNAIERRITKISLTRGEIELDFSKKRIYAHTFSPEAKNVIIPAEIKGTHGGGDRLIMDSLVDAIITGDRSRVLTSVDMSLDSHLLAFAAEEARVTGRVVDLKEFEAAARKRVAAG